MEGTTTRLHKFVVVGGGAGGLELATRLGRSLGKRGKAQVTLVEKGRIHLWKPLLHEVAAGSVDVGRHEVDYLAQAHWHGFRYHFGELEGIDRAERVVRLAPTFDEDGNPITPRRVVPYDTLAIAIGSVSNDFGTAGVRRHAIMLDSIEDAERFHRRIVNAIFRANTQAEPLGPGQLHIAIIGAGATGTELAAELRQTTEEMVAFGLHRIDPRRDIRITLIEAAENILPGLPRRLADKALPLLEGLDIRVRTGAKVAAVTGEGVVLADGEAIPSELVVWAAGVRGPEVLRNLDGLETNRAGQLVVSQTLQTSRDPAIFAFGDCAACPMPGSDRPVPPRAQAAHQQASHLFRQFRRGLAGRPPEPYRYRDFGSLVSLGESRAVGTLMGWLTGPSFFVEGLVARLMYLSLYKQHEIALRGLIPAMLESAGRMISRRAAPRVKLH